MITNKRTRVALNVPPSVSRPPHQSGSRLDVDAQSVIMLSGHYGPGTSMALHQLTMRWQRPCGEDACPGVGFQSHSSMPVSFSRKKKHWFELPAVPQGAFGGLWGRWDTGVRGWGVRVERG